MVIGLPVIGAYEHDRCMADEKSQKPRVYMLATASVVGPLRDKVRALAKETKMVFFSEHASKQMWDRDISVMEALEVLRIGEIAGPPWVEDTGEQACKVAFKKRGARTIGVVVIVLTEDGLFVKTVEWED
jgi:Domain of unknown function (DUF4258)